MSRYVYVVVCHCVWCVHVMASLCHSMSMSWHVYVMVCHVMTMSWYVSVLEWRVLVCLCPGETCTAPPATALVRGELSQSREGADMQQQQAAQGRPGPTSGSKPGCIQQHRRGRCNTAVSHNIASSPTRPWYLTPLSPAPLASLVASVRVRLSPSLSSSLSTCDLWLISSTRCSS